ncbi:plexin domain-containing protein 2 [Venturia canescens]|uniref:plexin domain-containing protein 2 n=1 Tax=Venturia canescens TaxID=32260 RepID=UPI001C9C5B5B|nr:plexin domain-containing protein 2 [Venturia canescens]
MACDGCALYTMLANRFYGFHLLIFVQLAFLLLGSSVVSAESDLSYYKYDALSWNSPREKTSSYLRSEDSEDELLARRRRYAGLEVRRESKTEEPVIKTGTNSSANVTYSTDKLTTLSGTTNSNVEGGRSSVTETTDLATPNAEMTNKSNKNTTIIVSNPMNPTNDHQIHIWANQTRWNNATQRSASNAESTTVSSSNSPDTSHKEIEGATAATTTTADGKSDKKMNNSTSNKTVAGQSTNSTDGELGDITITKFSDVTNNTLAQNNITKTEEDTHQYYNSTFFSDENIAKMYWVDIDNHPDRQVNDLLSKSHRRAATVKLKFDFPFYGHKVRNITIATGGFLYTGEYVHSWLAATQYIAPLMANFDTRISNDSWVKYADNGTAFTVEWERVVLQDRPKAGGFTFQATLHENGNIVFVYSKIPLTVEAIEDTAHPVKVGLSDAYIMDRTIFFVRRKTIYEYHRVNFNRQEIRNWTVIYLRALPTCLEMDNCNDCLTKVPEFECKWCPDLQQCSTGTFRHRQDWLEKGCERRNIKEKNSCPTTQRPYSIDHSDSHDHPGHVHSDDSSSVAIDQNSNGAAAATAAADPNILQHTASHMNMGVSGIIGILMVVSLMAGLAAWAGYAYRNPHSASGQMLIRYRPSQWSWRRGEARYTAATIHM